MGLAIVGMIIFMTLDNNDEALKTTLYVDDTIETLMLVIMLAAAIWVYRSIFLLDVNPSPISFLDDLLLIICQPAFLLIGFFNMIVAVGTWGEPGSEGLEVSFFTNIFMVIYNNLIASISKISQFLAIASIGPNTHDHRWP